MALRAGILGYGLAGRILHAPLIAAAGIEVAAVSTRRADEVRADFPNAAVEAPPEAVISRDDIDLIIVATPSYLHAAHALDAMAAGKHVVIDKPFATSIAEAETLIAAADKHKRVLCCFQNRRWGRLRFGFASDRPGARPFRHARLGASRSCPPASGPDRR